MGFQLNMPLGFRREMAGVRNAQLKLAKERAKLQEGELELSHQLAYAIRDLETNYVLSQTDFNRRIAAQRQVEAVAAAYETDTVTLDVVLEAQQDLAQAESDYYRALVNYNKSIAQVHFRKGSLLEYNGVYLAEGPWPGKAYFDARRRARARDASTYLDYGFTQPRVISRGPIEQQAGGGALFEGGRDGRRAGPGQTPTPHSRNWCRRPSPSRCSRARCRPSRRPRSRRPSRRRRSPAAARTAPAGTPWRDRRRLGGRTGDEQVTAAGWTAAEKGGNHESGANPPTAAVDRPASGWKGVQH